MYNVCMNYGCLHAGRGLHWIYGWEVTLRPMGLEIGQNALWGALLSLGTFRIHG